MFRKILQEMLKENLTLQILKQTDHCLKEKNENAVRLMKDELGGQITKKFVGLRDKKAKGTKKCQKNSLNLN